MNKTNTALSWKAQASRETHASVYTILTRARKDTENRGGSLPGLTGESTPLLFLISPGRGARFAGRHGVPTWEMPASWVRGLREKRAKWQVSDENGVSSRLRTEGHRCFQVGVSQAEARNAK